MTGVALWNVGEEMKAFYNKESMSVFESDDKAQAALRSFNKQGVIDAHKSLALAAIAHERLSRSEGTFRSCLPSYMDKFCVPARSSAEHLKPVGLADLQLGRCNRGVAIHGFLQVHPFRCSNVAVTVVEDDYGKAARLMAFNTLFWNSASEDVHKMYPLGGEVLIKEPCLVDGEFCQGTSLWVPNPISLELLSYFPQMQVDDPGVFLGWGAKEIGKQNNTGAVDLFTRCIRILQQRLENHELHESHSENKKSLVLALASRAEAWMKLDSYEKALQDAEAALALDPVDEKSLVAKGLALYGLSQYELSSETFKQASENSPTSSLLEASYKASLSFSEQSRSGVYDFSGYYIRGCVEESAPDVAEYVGPIEIRMSGEGRGRGLFLTRDAPAGEILLVTNAVALIFPDNKNDPAIMELDRFGTLLTAVLKKCVASPRVLAQVYSCSGEEVPDMELFQPNIQSQQQRNSTLELDLVRVSDVLQCVNENGKAADVLVGKDFEGFWTIPGFLNHSCLPNVGVHRVGKALLVVAARDIRAGEELERSYTSALAPWNPMRKQVLRFACRCHRCVLEEKLQEPLKGISARFDSILNATSMLEEEFLAELGGVAVELEQQMPALELTGEEQQWLRTSYCLAYLAHYTSSEQQLEEKEARREGSMEIKPVPPAETLVEALHSTAPGFSKTLMTMSCLSRYCFVSDVKGLLDQECFSLVGKQKDRVVSAILEQAMKKGKEFMW